MFSQTGVIVNRGFQAGGPKKVPLAGEGLGQVGVYGEDFRTSEHATVAMNESLDVVVAFNSDRNELGQPYLKQVEVAFFEYVSPDTWEWRETIIVGSIDYSPIFVLPVTQTTCERPDVIAVKDNFFVSWTRNYDSSTSGIQEDPAVLEGAWIEIVQGTSNKEMEITADPVAAGLGWQLDIDNPTGTRFYVRESKGVPDVVALEDANDPYKVAVVYAHQTDFSDPLTGDTTRSCDVRLVTCSFDPSTDTITSSATPYVLETDVPFNGDNDSTGITLPDAAPSGEQNALWVTAESQKESGGVRDGGILLGYWQFEPTTNKWERMAFRTYSSGSSCLNFLRRRPMVSAYPEGTGIQTVALTFGKLDPDAVSPEDESANVILKLLTYQNGSLESETTTILFDWPNADSLNDGKSVVVRGRSTPGVQFCLADEAGSPTNPGANCKLQAWSQTSGTMDTLVDFSPTGGTILGRPAVAYVFDTAAGTNLDYVAVSWEQVPPSSGAPLRVFFGVMP